MGEAETTREAVAEMMTDAEVIETIGVEETIGVAGATGVEETTGETTWRGRRAVQSAAKIISVETVKEKNASRNGMKQHRSQEHFLCQRIQESIRVWRSQRCAGASSTVFAIMVTDVGSPIVFGSLCQEVSSPGSAPRSCCLMVAPAKQCAFTPTARKSFLPTSSA